MKQRLIRTVPATAFYASVVAEAQAIAAAYKTGGVDTEMRVEALRQQRGTRRERLAGLRERLSAQKSASSLG